MSNDSKRKPSAVRANEVRTRIETKDEGFKVGVAVDAESHNSPLLLGLEWIKSGTEPVSWTADEVSHEVYYIERGQLEVACDGEPSAVLDAGDSYYFPPSHTYTAVNTGEDDVFLVWSIVPSPGYSEHD